MVRSRFWNTHTHTQRVNSICPSAISWRGIKISNAFKNEWVGYFIPQTGPKLHLHITPKMTYHFLDSLQLDRRKFELSKLVTWERINNKIWSLLIVSCILIIS